MKSRIAAVLTFSFFAPMALAAAPTSCPFSAGELKSALNSEFKEGKVGFESDFGTGKSLSCRYEGKNMSLVVKQTVMKDPAQTRGWEAGLAGKKEKVANDPDGALCDARPLNVSTGYGDHQGCKSEHFANQT